MENTAYGSDRTAIEQIIVGLDEAWRLGHAEAFAAQFALDCGITNVLDVAIAVVDAELSGYDTRPPGTRAGADGVMRTMLPVAFPKEQEGWCTTSYDNVAVTPLPPGP